MKKVLALAAVGIAVGLLLRTEKGKKLRSDLTDSSSDLFNKLNKLSKQKLSEVEDLLGSTRKKSKELV